MSEYYVNQIFIDEYEPEAAEWCNCSQGTDRPCCIDEIESLDGHRRFQIHECHPSEKQIIQARINELQTFLDSTDWYCSRYVDIGTPIPDDIKQQRSDARIEIDRLRHELEPVTVEATDDEPTSPTDSPTD